MIRIAAIVVLITAILLIVLPTHESSPHSPAVKGEEDESTTPNSIEFKNTPRPLATLKGLQRPKAVRDPLDSNDESDVTQDNSGSASGVIVKDSRLEGGNSSSYSSSQDSSGGSGTRGSGAIDALRELEVEPGRKYPGHYFGGARVSTTSEVPTPSATEIPINTPKTTPTPKPVTGQPRGYSMLYLMEPNARQTVEKQLTAMLDSQVQSLYLGVLVDGTFTRDFNYLLNIVRRIERAKRTLTLVLYLTNGPAMRNKSRSRPESPFSDFQPSEFRTLIQTDSNVRESYVELIKPIIPVLQLNRRLNSSNRNFVVVMLEDNLDDESYLAMRALTSTVTSNRANFIRNPCPGCVEGNTSNGLGDGVEFHNAANIDTLGFNDALTLDGQGYALPNENDLGQISYDEVNGISLKAAARGIRFFGLWRFQRQGLQVGVVDVPPSSRTYEVPSNSDLEAEIKLLRAGLTELQ